MHRIKLLLGMALSILAIAACASTIDSNDTFKSITIGYSTPSGNEIWVKAVEFDSSWGVPGGGLACCWENPGKMAIVFNRAMPKVLRIAWLEESTQNHYDATISLSEDTASKARRLPNLTYIPIKRKKPPIVMLIIGMAPGGDVTVWLSNSSSGKHRKGRVLDVVGMAKATITSNP